MRNLKLFLPAAMIELYRAQIDEMYPHVELYETRPVGEEPKLIRGVLHG